MFPFGSCLKSSRKVAWLVRPRLRDSYDKMSVAGNKNSLGTTHGRVDLVDLETPHVVASS
jgi:hypothetical protein